MAKLLQRLQTRLGAIGVLVLRVALDQELIGLRRIDVEFLPLQTLPTQHRHFGVNERPRPAGAVDLRQLQHHTLAVAAVIGPVGIVQMVVHGPTGAANDTGRHD